MLLCVGNFFGSTSEAEWAEYRTGAKKGKEGGWCYRGGWHCFTARLGIQEWCGVKAVVLQQGNPTQEAKMGLFGAPLHHFGANLTQAGKGDVDGAEVVHLQLWEHHAGDSLCKRVSCAVLVAPKVCWRV